MFVSGLSDVLRKCGAAEKSSVWQGVLRTSSWRYLVSSVQRQHCVTLLGSLFLLSGHGLLGSTAPGVV